MGLPFHYLMVTYIHKLCARCVRNCILANNFYKYQSECYDLVEQPFQEYRQGEFRSTQQEVIRIGFRPDAKSNIGIIKIF